MGKWPLSPVCTLLWHHLRSSWMQPLFKRSETRNKVKEKEPNRKEQTHFFKRNENKSVRSVILRWICHVVWNVKSVMFSVPTRCCVSHCSGWSETETVTVASSARGRRGGRCAARTGGAMRPAVSCRGRAARIKHWHWHTAAGVEVRTELWVQKKKPLRVHSRKLQFEMNLLNFNARNWFFTQLLSAACFGSILHWTL